MSGYATPLEVDRMSSRVRRILGSSIFRKQVIALTGLGMVGFVVFHLGGNLLIYAGPEAFNAYSKKLHDLGWLLWVARFGLIAAFVVHVWLTVSLWRENNARRPQGYVGGTPKGDRSFATYTMRYTGVLIAVFLLLHLYDFTFRGKDGPLSVVASVDPAESLGLFGLVWNSFHVWWRVPIYVLAVAGVGLHLAHAIQSVFQTFGFNHDRFTFWVKVLSVAIGIIVGAGFALIPIYVMLAPKPLGV